MVSLCEWQLNECDFCMCIVSVPVYFEDLYVMYVCLLSSDCACVCAYEVLVCDCGKRVNM